ncbi:hypothetical protein [Streptomyces sp. NPDC006274]
MTRISAENPEMSVEDFEELAHNAPEGVTLETEKLKEYAQA